MRAGNNHEKEYFVTVNKSITDDFLVGMGNGIPILGTVTKKCFVEKVADKIFKIVLTQGLNRQIRRMCEYLDYEVKEIRVFSRRGIEKDERAISIENSQIEVISRDRDDELNILKKL